MVRTSWGSTTVHQLWEAPGDPEARVTVPIRTVTPFILRVGGQFLGETEN